MSRASYLAWSSALTMMGCGLASHAVPDGGVTDGSAGSALDDGAGLTCVDRPEGWSAVPMAVGLVDTVAVDRDGRVYAPIGGAGVFAFDERGAERWHRALNPVPPRMGRSLDVGPGGEVFLLTDLDTRVRVGDAELGPGQGLASLSDAGELRWYVELEGALRGVAVSGSEVVVFRDRAGQREAMGLAEGGEVQWSTSFGDAYEPIGWSIAASPDGRVAVAWSGFVASLAPGGELLWSQRVPGRELHDVAVDSSGRVAIVGTFNGSADFGGGNIGPSRVFDAYVAVFDSEGAHLWSRALQSWAFDYAYGASFGREGELVVTGHFGEGGGGATQLDFGGVAPLLSADDDRDLFLVAYDESGAVRWATSVDGEGDVAGRSVAVGPCGDVTVGGFFRGAVRLEGRLHERVDPGPAFIPFVWQTTRR